MSGTRSNASAPATQVSAAVRPGASFGALAAEVCDAARMVDDAGLAACVASLSLERKVRLLTGAGVDAGLAGAVGLLATPHLALDIDVAAAGSQVKAWHRQADGAVATLATCDGIVFELAWFRADQWPGELARVAAIPDDVDLGDSAVPATVDVPFQLVDAMGEALRSGRADLVPVLIGLAAWGSKHAPRDWSPVATHDGCGAEIAVEVRCGAGHEVAPGDVLVTG